jgi:hypothetical protein
MKGSDNLLHFFNVVQQQLLVAFGIYYKTFFKAQKAKLLAQYAHRKADFEVRPLTVSC